MSGFDWSAVPRRREHRQLGTRPPWFNGGPVSQLAIDPRGRFFATMGSRGGRLFHAATGELLATLEGSTNLGSAADHFAFTDEGRVIGRLADRVIRVWDAPSGALVRAHEEVVECERLCGADARGDRVLVRDDDAWPVVHDLARGTRKRMSSRPYGGAGAAAFIGGGLVLGLSSGDDHVFCWEAASGEERWRVSHARFGSAIVAPPGADWFALGGKAGGALLCDVATGAARAQVPSAEKYWVRHVSATPDGRRLLVASVGVISFDVASRTVATTISHRSPEGCTAAIAPDGTWFVLGYDDGELRSTNAAAGLEFEGHRARIDAVLFDAAGDVAARDRSGRTLTWPANGGAPRPGGVFPAETPPAAWAAARRREIDQAITRSYLTSDSGGLSALYANETLALSLDNYGVYRIWRRDATDSVEIDPGTAPGSPTRARVVTAILHPDGRRVAAGTTRADAPVQIWDGVEGRPLAILEGSESSVEALAFDATGTRLAAGGLDRVVRIWQIDDELPR